MRPVYLILVTIVLSLALSTPAHALLTGCDASATPVSFGTYDPTSNTPRDGAGTITVTCNVLLIGLFTSWDILLSSGGGTLTARRMASGGNLLFYNLYTDASRATIWGDGSASTAIIHDSISLIVGSNARSYTVYGRIPVHQDRPSATYTDLITVTLNY